MFCPLLLKYKIYFVKLNFQILYLLSYKIYLISIELIHLFYLLFWIKTPSFFLNYLLNLLVSYYLKLDSKLYNLIVLIINLNYFCKFLYEEIIDNLYLFHYLIIFATIIKNCYRINYLPIIILAIIIWDMYQIHPYDCNSMLKIFIFK